MVDVKLLLECPKTVTDCNSCGLVAYYVARGTDYWGAVLLDLAHEKLGYMNQNMAL